MRLLIYHRLSGRIRAPVCDKYWHRKPLQMEVMEVMSYKCHETIHWIPNALHEGRTCVCVALSYILGFSAGSGIYLMSIFLLNTHIHCTYYMLNSVMGLSGSNSLNPRNICWLYDLFIYSLCEEYEASIMPPGNVSLWGGSPSRALRTVGSLIHSLIHSFLCSPMHLLVHQIFMF